MRSAFVGSFLVVRKGYAHPEALIRMVNFWTDNIDRSESDPVRQFFLGTLDAPDVVLYKYTPVVLWEPNGTIEAGRKLRQALAKQLEEKRASELAPERRVEEKRAEDAVKAAAGVEPAGIDREIGQLRSEIGKLLADVSERLGAESARFRNVQKAVEAKESELRELYGIEKSAVSLAALIEAQNQKRSDFETQMAGEREELQAEIDLKRTEWEEEKRLHEAEVKERDATEKKAQDRVREDFATLAGLGIDFDAMEIFSGGSFVFGQLERRVSFRRAMKKAMESAFRFGAKGVKIMVAGRLGGAEIARTEWYQEGRLPLHTLKADIDFGFAEARTTYGVIGVKVWVYKGDLLKEKARRVSA